ncbi:hypothetical protein [Rickettsia endosymbiont of Cantharis rufa]|uniref:hypothetical protein n=1 Tax=Rickettsia endosymbiont of Cantharis rufa TaxID=3066248 RepID=UPI003132C9D5
MWKFKALFGLEEDTETVIDNNNLEGGEVADLINIPNTVSIAKGEFDSVAEKVDNALNYDQKNEEALETDIALLY